NPNADMKIRISKSSSPGSVSSSNWLQPSVARKTSRHQASCSTGPTRAAAATQATRGMTLVEMIVAVGVGSLVLMVIAMVFMSSSRAFAAARNYVAMDSSSRNALDHLTQEIRQAGNLVEFSANHLKFGYQGTTNSFLVFDWNAASGELTEWNTS